MLIRDEAIRVKDEIDAKQKWMMLEGDTIPNIFPERNWRLMVLMLYEVGERKTEIKKQRFKFEKRDQRQDIFAGRNRCN